MHLVLKFETETEHNNKSYDVIREHKSLAENEGSVWWGKTVREGKSGSGFADKRLNTFNSQLDSNIETNVYLFENKPGEKAYQAKVLNIVRDFKDIDIDKLPNYYKENAETTNELFIELSEIHEVDRSVTLESLERFDSPENVGFVRSFQDGQSSRFYVRKRLESESRPQRISDQFGEISGLKVGSVFKDRKELFDAGVHRATMAGICGSQEIGAYSLVLSGGYEDDFDNLNSILYTGHGGQDEKGKQVKDQEFTRGNKALSLNMEENLPVRVIRGYQVENGPESGYRYDGIYYVRNFYTEKGKSGFNIYRYELTTDQSFQYLREQLEDTFKEDYELPERAEVFSSRQKRNQIRVNKVNELNTYTCQVCGEFFEGVNGPICVGAHIQPLGLIHEGPDVIENLLVLCPNHHELFDRYGFYIDENFKIQNLKQQLINNEKRKLRINKKHKINPKFSKYHREKYFEITLKSSK